MSLFARERQQELNTLACLAMGLQGWKTTVELHNDSFACGRIVEVDVKMNIEMSEVRYTDGNGKMLKLDNFHVSGRRIRYIHIPDQVDIMKLIEKKVLPNQPQKKITKKAQIALKRTQQTLKRYRREQEAQAGGSKEGT
ncbi:U7 snRNA-associated Sm-like protein LSm10 [Penaeus chinensis]|uniref:U7 snRNA-associated Sm-like protein LSm10 n=1 Tax=Penaeus chinensis TaxID=139456 RepID=UPI001FB749D0|nr:U7 snRNA-associated Sm-like protein LSm10 [Penaeus chinensis]XP_047498054.1 U7 snRNA-associated Sm-like protein LSm10 [Penaeus chinensis]XP_047498055.1 U7 snRNA-associated Sm-like protein LSm10 [Penaeus chinensis]XP_047498056.1 U7 snRNA-associated Sm-like protein LSm10 [Penaeus chinensis]